MFKELRKVLEESIEACEESREQNYLSNVFEKPRKACEEFREVFKISPKCSNNQKTIQEMTKLKNFHTNAVTCAA